MAYCSVTEVASEFKDISFDADSSITETEIEDFIDQESAFIDAKIAEKYETPVTGTSALLVLKKICIAVVAYRAKLILAVKTGEDSVDQETRANYQMVSKMISDIAAGKTVLSDATRATAHDGFASYNSDQLIEPVFDVTSQQW